MNIMAMACHDVSCGWEGGQWPDTKQCPNCSGPVYRILDAEIEDMLRYGMKHKLNHAVTFLRECTLDLPREGR